MSLTLLDPVRLPPLLGKVGVGLLGLLESADPVPVVADVGVHVDAATGEMQSVRAVDVPWGST